MPKLEILGLLEKLRIKKIIKKIMVKNYRKLKKKHRRNTYNILEVGLSKRLGPLIS